MDSTAVPREAATTKQNDVWVIVVKSEPGWTASTRKRVRAAANRIRDYGLVPLAVKPRKRGGFKR